MTNNTGKVKKHKKRFQHLNKKGARVHRREFIEVPYLSGVYNQFGDQVIRPLNEEEKKFLDIYYKEFVHGTFITNQESTRLFKKAKRLSKKPENVLFFKENGTYPEEVLSVIEEFNTLSKQLGNIAFDFWIQREINSDDYKRKYDIQNNSQRGLQLESFEDLQYASNTEEFTATIIEDLITESEE